jgi:hypothetical protein
MKYFVTILLVTFIAAGGLLSQEITSGDPTSEGAGAPAEELIGGTWVLAGAETKIVNKQNITKWETLNNDLVAVYSWKDVIEIIHTVSAGYKWQAPPKTMQPGAYMNLEAVYTNIEYSTTAKVPSGIRMFIQRDGADLIATEPNAIEILKVNKDNKQYSNEVKKGFFYAPKFLFDDSRNCQLVVDCFVGKDHYVTKYTYTYQQ